MAEKEEKLDAFCERRRNRQARNAELQLEDPTMSFGVMGWLCPICGMGISPLVGSCPCVGIGDPAPELETEQDWVTVKDWSKLVRWYDQDSSEKTPNHEIVAMVLDDLKDGDRLLAQTTNQQHKIEAQASRIENLESEKQILEDRVEGLLEGAVSTGSLAPLLKRVRELASMLGVEIIPNAEQMKDVVEYAITQIATMKEVVRELRNQAKAPTGHMALQMETLAKKQAQAIARTHQKRDDESDPIDGKHGIGEA